MILKTIFAIAFSCCFISCTTAIQAEGKSAKMPLGWGPLAVGSDTHCESITGIYNNHGEWVLNDNEPILSNALLSLSVFLRNLPNAEIPETVGLIVDENGSNLHVSFFGSHTEISKYPMSCESGIPVISMEQGRDYLGDGVEQHYLKRRIFFHKSRSDDLIINIKSEGEFRSSFVLNTKEEAESWYKFVSASEESERQ